ncbi:hypothetical protein Tco_0813138 [Tanacetum coccineum]
MFRNLEGKAVKFLMYPRYQYHHQPLLNHLQHQHIQLLYPHHQFNHFHHNHKYRGLEGQKRREAEVSQPSGPTMIAGEAMPTESNKPLSEEELKKTKKVYSDSFTKLIKKVKKLERIKKVRSFEVPRRRTRIILSDEDEELDADEDAYNQGDQIDNIDQDDDITSINEDQGRINDSAQDIHVVGPYKQDLNEP